MKYALIGCGRIAVNHLKAAVNNELEIVGLCDIDLSKIDIMSEKAAISVEGYHRYSDYKEMLEKVKQNITELEKL